MHVVYLRKGHLKVANTSFQNTDLYIIKKVLIKIYPLPVMKIIIHQWKSGCVGKIPGPSSSRYTSNTTNTI